MMELLRTPQRKRPLMLFAVLLILSQPIFIPLHYLWNELAGAYPPDADSIGIPIFFGWIAWIIFAPVAFACSVWALARYPGSVWLFNWDYNRPGWSIGWSFVFLLLVMALGLEIFSDLRWVNLPSLLNDGMWMLLLIELHSIVIAKERWI
jgi:hypothetical protein